MIAYWIADRTDAEGIEDILFIPARKLIVKDFLLTDFLKVLDPENDFMNWEGVKEEKMRGISEDPESIIRHCEKRLYGRHYRVV